MLKNYFKTAWRSLTINKAQSFINMRLLFFFILLLFYSLDIGCQSVLRRDNVLKVVKSTSNYIIYRINGVDGTWHINPSLKPDVLKFQTAHENNTVSFVTNIDSIQFIVRPNDSIHLAILLNGDTAYTEIVCLPKRVNFKDEYKRIHQGEISISIPEVSELANVILAITDVGIKDSNMIAMKGNYHKDVLNWFMKYKHEPLIKHIDSLMQRNDTTENYWFYYALKMNACGYYFNRSGNIVQDSTILKMGFDNYVDPIKQNLEDVQDFAEKTNFKKFYANHKPYYDSLIDQYKKLIPVLNMKHWLEQEFDNRIDYYMITFSPLVYGAHATNWFYDNGFTVAAMFVAPLLKIEKYSLNFNNINNLRILFTEIDHNYVNPVSSNYVPQIDSIFDNQPKCANGDKSGIYPSPFKIFNEYMTWAVFTLYCYDNYPEIDLEEYMKKTEEFMEEKRGFNRFADFDHQLLKIYKEHKGLKKVNELFPEILKWCSTGTIEKM
ncbi:MAG TPA: DUF4932 domain-containing protein [Hanamia sp.]